MAVPDTPGGDAGHPAACRHPEGAARRRGRGAPLEARDPLVMQPDGEIVYWPSSAASRASMARAPDSELAIE